MSLYRALVNIRLADGRTVSPKTGTFELSDAEASKLEKWWIAPAIQPLGPGLADEIVEQQAKDIEGLKKTIEEKDKQILTLQNIINSKEADIDRLKKVQTATQAVKK